ncbi:MAG: NAD-dependent succinate-semialdehyde dehydrogenase [Candidatus Nanoarchaeia archaeon]
MAFIIKSPISGEPICIYQPITQNKLKTVISKANKAFLIWANFTVKERCNFIKKLGLSVKKNKEDLAKIITEETGKPIKQSFAEIEKCILFCEYVFKNADKILSPEKIETDANARIEFEPLGIIAEIMPWNFPFWQVFRATLPTLVSGNTVILRHSTFCLKCACAIETLFREVFPKNVFNSVIGGHDIVEAIIKDKNIKGVSFTGSVETGKKIYSLAAENLKKCVLELGGSDPFIVLKDADVLAAAEAGVRSRFANAGQSCTSAKRFIVERKIADQFVKHFTKLTAELKIGNPFDIDTDIGPLVNEEQIEKLDFQVKKSLEMGAKILLGGKRLPISGYYYTPTILTNIKPKMPVWKEETFGPVAPIMIVENEKEAIKMANNSKYGLGASLWTRNLKKANNLEKKIEAGFVAINGNVRSDPNLPFGGVKESGIGRELDKFGFFEFVNIKSIKIYK